MIHEREISRIFSAPHTSYISSYVYSHHPARQVLFHFTSEEMKHLRVKALTNSRNVYIMPGVRVPLLYTFAITCKIVNIKVVNFIVRKLYLIRAVRCVFEECVLSSLFYSLENEGLER